MIDTLPINESEYQLWEELTYSQNWATWPNFGQAPFETGCELLDGSELVLLRFTGRTDPFAPGRNHGFEALSAILVEVRSSKMCPWWAWYNLYII